MAESLIAPASTSATVQEERLHRHVTELAGVIGERNVFRPQALAAAADYVETCWTVDGYRPVRQWYETHGVRCANIEVTLPGTTEPDAFLIVGAHYDSVRGAPGANDNGSGVAALLELSRLARNASLPVSLRLVAFVNEEPPFFLRSSQGSMVYARAARARRDDIRLMIALDELGCYSNEPSSQHYPPPLGFLYPHVANFIGLVSNLQSRREMLRFAAHFQAASDFPLEHIATTSLVPGVSWSDHRSFWKTGYRAFMVTDTAFYRYRHYHRATDTPDKLAYPEFTAAADGLVRAVLAMAADPLLRPA
jgi:Zn-dependent M28 family amino/carboxypeptidase